MLFHCSRVIVFAAVIVVFARGFAFAGSKTAGGYELSGESFSGSGGTGVTAGAYALTFSVGQQAGRVDLFQNPGPGQATSGYVIEAGYVSGMEAVFDIFSVTAGASAPVSLGYTGAASDTVPGARVTYNITYSNKGEAAVCDNSAGGCPAGTLSEIPVTAALPAEVVYDAGSIVLNAVAQTDALDFVSGANECGYDSGTKAVKCVISMVAGASGSFQFTAVIK